MVYNVLIGLGLIYLVTGGGQPWAEKNYERSDGCNTAAMRATSSAELYFYQNVTNLFNPQSCAQYEFGDDVKFSWGLFLACVITWIICFLCIMFGVKSSSYVAMVAVPIPFLMLFILVG